MLKKTKSNKVWISTMVATILASILMMSVASAGLTLHWHKVLRTVPVHLPMALLLTGAAGSSSTNPVLTASCGVYPLDREVGETTSGEKYTSAEDDVSAVCVINDGSLTPVSPTIPFRGAPQV